MGPAPAVAAVRTAVRATLCARDDRARDDRPVLVACSGGADSLALAAATAFVVPRLGRRAGLVTIDHGLQPGSAERAARVASIGAELGLDPVTTIRVEVGRRGGPEAAARTARYDALGATATAEDAVILLAHTLDDQAETVLLGLGRGSGPRSVVGMPAVDGCYIRPLLEVRRATTVAACEAEGLAYWDDPHNTDPSYQRTRLRHEVLPLLEDVLQDGVAEALARTADLLRDDLAALDALAAATLPSLMISVVPDKSARYGRDHERVDAVRLGELPRAVRTRVLRLWVARLGAGPLSSERTAAVDDLVTNWHGQGAVQLPGGVSVVRASGTLNAVPRPAPEENRV
ncbi:MAG: tRNA lysidine(34) synthetase TilS [Jatrophihabitans sp.]